jgi:hypothetical protein
MSRASARSLRADARWLSGPPITRYPRSHTRSCVSCSTRTWEGEGVLAHSVIKIQSLIGQSPWHDSLTERREGFFRD